MEKKKILILHAPLGAGHGAAAEAIAESFAKRHPNIEVKNVDVLDFAFKVFKKGLPRAYFLISSKVPFVFKWMYKYHKRPSRHAFLSKISDVMLKGSSFLDFLKKFRPDFIISTNPLPMHLVSETKEKNIIDIPSANICTDFGFHSFWYNKDVNYYFVAVEEIKKRFVSRGVKSSAIIVTGIPIKSKFTKICNREQIIDKLNLNKSHPVLLIIGGKMGYGNLREILYNIKEKDKNAQFIIVSGRDARLKERLEESEYKNDPTVKIFGFADNLEELMTAADLILTKAGGITVAECLAKNLPMIINDVIPGQEEDNVRYVVLNKAGFKVKNERKCAEIIADLFLDSRKMERLRKNCKKIAKPDAADMLVDFVASKLD